METFAENLAHFSHGMAFLFFIVWTVRLFPLRRRNNMLKILFFGMAYMAFIEAKDTVYLADENWFSDYVTWLSVIADLPIVPILALFFFEVISPGYVTWTKASIVMLPFVCFIVFYIIEDTECKTDTGTERQSFRNRKCKPEMGGRGHVYSSCAAHIMVGNHMG